MHYIYITTNRKNNKKYIGQRKLPTNKTLNTDEYLGSGTALIEAINKYGKRWFSKEIISTHKKQIEADNKEIELINYYNAVDSEMYYNISGGGQFGRVDDHSSVMSNIMNNYYNDDYNYTNARIKSNRKRIKKGLKPTYYTIAERDIDKLRKSMIKANDKKQCEYKKKVNRMVRVVVLRDNKSIRNTPEYKKKESDRNRNIAIKSWEANRDSRVKSMSKAWNKRKADANGVVFNDDYKRKLSIAKLEKSGNYVGLYLVDNGCISSAFIRKPLSKLLCNEYKDYQNYIKQLKKVCALIVERGINMNDELLHDLVCDSRKANGKSVYCVAL